MHPKIVLIATIFFLVSCQSVNNKTIEPSESPAKNGVEFKNNPQKRDADLIAIGVDFYAMGENPFWILTIDFDQSKANLELSGDKKYDFDIVDNRENAVENLQFDSKETTLILSAKEASCYSSITGEGFDYSIEIAKGTTSLQGCGKYLGEPLNAGAINVLLFSEWQLRTFQGKALAKAEQPTLKLTHAQSQASGFSSCNNYFGSFLLSGNYLSFKDFGMTRKFCAQSIEVEYMALLQKTYKYYIENKQLFLLDINNNQLLTFSLR
jgi:heat shock protein HslJ/uncharacterized membrane protein